MSQSLRDQKFELDVPEIVAKRQKHRQKSKAGMVGTQFDPRMRKLIVVPKEVMDFKRVIITPAQYHLLKVDTRYQREEIKLWVNDLRDACSRGSIPPPIDLVKRTYIEAGAEEPSKSYFVVDGQQRMWAMTDLGMDIQAQLHEVPSYALEVALFAVLNSRKGVNSNLKVKNWNGPSARLLRGASSDPGHDFYDRIGWDSPGMKGGKFTPTIVITTVSWAVGTSPAGGIDRNLPHLDAWIEKNGPGKASLFLSMLSLAFPTDHRFDQGILVAFAKAWKAIGQRGLTKVELSKVRKLKLDKVTASTYRERVGLMKARIEKAIRGKEGED